MVRKVIFARRYHFQLVNNQLLVYKAYSYHSDDQAESLRYNQHLTIQDNDVRLSMYPADGG
jgi:hypothetical protein